MHLTWAAKRKARGCPNNRNRPQSYTKLLPIHPPEPPCLYRITTTRGCYALLQPTLQITQNISRGFLGPHHQVARSVSITARMRAMFLVAILKTDIMLMMESIHQSKSMEGRKDLTKFCLITDNGQKYRLAIENKGFVTGHVLGSTTPNYQQKMQWLRSVKETLG